MRRFRADLQGELERLNPAGPTHTEQSGARRSEPATKRLGDVQRISFEEMKTDEGKAKFRAEWASGNPWSSRACTCSSAPI
jgi:hypothetical protein